MRVKHYAFAAASVVLLVLVLAPPVMADQGNAKPCLCHPKLSPTKGTARTVFAATVTYHDPDGDAPAKVEVYIDNTAYPMKRVGGRPANGTYRARLTLPPGEHSYYFYAEDARGESERFPRYGTYTGPFVGPKGPMNRLPLLTEGGVRDNYGSDRSIFTYTVHYRDRDVCKPPRAVKVFIDGISHDMRLHSGTRINGTYLYQTMLPAGPHAYYFMAMDGDGDCVSLPAKGFIRGPEVLAGLNSPPVLLEQRVEPPTGSMRNRYGFLVHYNDVDFDAPATALIYVDNIPHAMKRVKGNAANGLYSYVTGHFLSGMHTYYFYFEDGKGGSCRLPAIGSFHGPVVTR
jgi:hypothetical protein